MKPKDKQKTIDFYEKKLLEYGNGFKVADWDSQENQKLRFNILLASIIPLSILVQREEHSILDVGCGVGDLYKFIKKGNFNLRYTGYDLSPQLIATAKKNFPEARFEVKDILKEDISERFDYVFASGSLSLKIVHHQLFVEAMIKKMFDLSKCACAFNLLSTYAYQLPSEIYRQDRLRYYVQPEKIFSYGKSLTPRVTLRHDYSVIEFTVYMYK